jgi:large subunit ribosomal protein L25
VKENILKVDVRTQTGKGAARKLRATGFIPAVLYGQGTEATGLSVSDYDFRKLISKASSASMIIDLTVGDAEPRKVIIKEIQTDPVSAKIDSIDFEQISMDKEITLSLPIKLVGTPEGVKNQGGILEFLHREIEISCLPGNIPEKIELDVSELKIGDALHYSDISLDNVEILSNPKVSVVTVVAPTVTKEKVAVAEGEEAAEVVEAAAEAEGEEAGEPELVKEKKEKKEEKE